MDKAVETLEPFEQQAERDRTRGLIIVVPGVRIPDAVFLFAKREPVAMHRRALPQKLRDSDGGILKRRL